jgi:hypothetical protein
MDFIVESWGGGRRPGWKGQGGTQILEIDELFLFLLLLSLSPFFCHLWSPMQTMDCLQNAASTVQKQ